VFNQVQYQSGSGFVLSASQARDNMIEANMQALKSTYDLNSKQFKDVIGNLNWLKFSDRI
jgi:hypothetical protein